jgi:hypothetical protein
MGVVTIYEILDILDPTDDYKIQATDTNDNVITLIDSDSVISYMIRKYGSRKYKIFAGAHTSEEDAKDFFHSDWRMYLNNRQHGIDRMYQAMYDQNYSPIENVFADETETLTRDYDTTYGKSESGAHSDSTTSSDTKTYNSTLGKTGTETDVHSGSIQNENSKAGFNTTNSYTKDTKTVETFQNEQHQITYNTTDSHGGTDSESGNTTQSGTNSLTLSGKDQIDESSTRHFTRNGNVGVTSSQELINQELDLYQKSLAEMLITNFIDDYTFYA